MINHYPILDYLLEGFQIVDFEWRYVYVNETAAKHGRTTRAALIGHTMMEVYPGIEYTHMFSALKRCMEERTPSEMENEFTYPDGSKGWFELRIAPVPEGVFVLSIDITARKQAEQEIEQQLFRIQSLRAIDLAILGTTDLRLALRTVLRETRERLFVDAAMILLLDHQTLMLEMAAHAGLGTAGIQRANIRLGEGPIGRATLEHHTLTFPNLNESTREGVIIPLALEEGLQALFSVPLIAKGQIVGVLIAGHRTPLQPTLGWLDFLEALAGQAAMAIDSGKSYLNLQRAHLDLALAYDTTIEGWSRALELRDKETEGHSTRVTDMAVKLARMAGMSGEEIIHVKRGALLHDIGKMGIPDSILLKPGRLTEDEWEIIRKHPKYAYELLLRVGYLRPALDIPYCHHERWDGTGYPRGLKGEQIPLAARLFTVVDVWDALRFDRPYRKGWSEAEVADYIQARAGTFFDPYAVDLFFKMLEEQKRED